MGWLDLINLATSLSTAQKLEQMREQGATVAMITSLIAELRNQVFNFKQTAEEILELAENSPKMAAGAMKLLELRLNESGISAELFPEFNDKEYVASSFRFIKDKGNQFLLGLSSQEKAQVNEMVAAARILPDYTYYLDKYELAEEYIPAYETYEELKSRHTPGARRIMYAFYALWMFIFLFGSTGNSGLIAGIITLIIVIIGVRIYWTRTGEYNAARKVVEQYDFDFERFKKIGEEFDENREKVIKAREHAQMLVQRYFEGSGLLQENTISSGKIFPKLMEEIETPAEGSTKDDLGVILTNEGEFECVRCGKMVSVNSSICPHCGLDFYPSN